MVKFSHNYRAVIKSCVLDLQKQISMCLLDITILKLHCSVLYIACTFCVLLEMCKREEERQQCESQLQVFDMIELIWNLCEILYIDVQPGKHTCVFAC